MAFVLVMQRSRSCTSFGWLMEEGCPLLTSPADQGLLHRREPCVARPRSNSSRIRRSRWDFLGSTS